MEDITIPAKWQGTAGCYTRMLLSHEYPSNVLVIGERLAEAFVLCDVAVIAA